MPQPLERTIHDIEQLREAFKEASILFKTTGKPHELTFTCDFQAKTTPQLRYAHKVVLPILADALYSSGIISINDKGVAKDWLKEEAKYGSYYIRTLNGKPEARFVGKSLADAKKSEMIGILNLAIERCAFLGAIVPEPNEFKLKE